MAPSATLKCRLPPGAAVISIRLDSFVPTISSAIATSMSESGMKFHKIPIRDGEKLHEEMISSIEMQRVEDTESDKYLSIGYKRISEDYNRKPLNSEFHLIDSDEAFMFLVNKGVL